MYYSPKQIWDTAGQEKYRSIAPIYYREARIALCVYDITSKRSYEVMKKWVEELQSNGPKDIVLAVVGNKIDRCDEEEVDYAEVKEYATGLGAILKLVSAKEGKNIDV
jgi:small GTP-binding protein